MELLSQFAPRTAGTLPVEPETSLIAFRDTDMANLASDRCPISLCDPANCVASGQSN